MPSRKLDSNEELVLDLMRYSKHGPLGQVFIVEAIRTYAEKQAAEKPRALREGDLIDPALWRLIAVDVKSRCDAFYSRHDGAGQENQVPAPAIGSSA